MHETSKICKTCISSSMKFKKMCKTYRCTIHFKPHLKLGNFNFIYRHGKQNMRNPE